MFSTKLDAKDFEKDLRGIVEYSLGFLDGVQRGKNIFLRNLGSNISEVLKQYIDSNARVAPQMLHHIYEWEKTGSPDARLFDIAYTVNGTGLSFGATLRQSMSVQSGSTTPFYDKARIMEEGIPVTIKPSKSGVLVFDDNGEQVFTRKPVTVTDPGGTQVQGGLERTFKSFFDSYVSQAFLQSSGLSKYLQNPEIFSKGISSSRRGGRSLGITTGFRWITNAGVDL